MEINLQADNQSPPVWKNRKVDSTQMFFKTERHRVKDSSISYTWNPPHCQLEPKVGSKTVVPLRIV